jgi:hypothetical protein
MKTDWREKVNIFTLGMECNIAILHVFRRHNLIDVKTWKISLCPFLYISPSRDARRMDEGGTTIILKK